MKNSFVMSRRLLCGAVVTVLASYVAGCHGGGSGVSAVATPNPYTTFTKTLSPSTDLKAYFASIYQGSNYTYSSGTLSQGIFGQVVTTKDGQLYGNLRDFFNPSNGYSDAQKDAYIAALTISSAATALTYTRTVSDATTNDFEGILGVILTVKNNDINTVVQGFILSSLSATRKQLSVAVLQQYANSGIFDQTFVSRLKAGDFAIYSDTVEVAGINLTVKFVQTTTSLLSAGVKDKVLGQAGSLTYTVKDNLTTDAVLVLASNGSITVASGLTAGSQLLTTKATSLSVLGIGTQPHYDAGAKVSLTSQLQTSDGLALPGLAVQLSLYYIRNYVPLTNKYTSYTGVTDTNGLATFNFQLPFSDEDYAMVADFAGNTQYDASKSFTFKLLVGN